MSPFLRTRLRAMSTTLVIVLSLAVAAVLAWLVRRYEVERETRPSTAGSRVLDAVFTNGAGDTEDSVLLAQLLAHRAECIGDPTYVDQVRRLLVNTRQLEQARAILKSAGEGRTFSPDELKAQF